MEEVIIVIQTKSTGDAERDAMGFIPQALKDLSQERATEVLKYLVKRYEAGDTFGLK